MTGEDEVSGQATGIRAGEQLREAREAQGLPLTEVAQRTRIPLRHLRLIEEGGYQGLPAATYSAGFVKSYARLLGLDAQALSERFRGEIDRATVRPDRPEPYQPADPRRTPPMWLAALALLLAFVVGIGFLYWRGSRDQPVALAAAGTSPPSTEVASSPPSPGPPVSGSNAPAAGPAASAAVTGNVTVGATQDVWVKVSASGKTLFMGTLAAGKTVLVPADAVDPLLTTGRPGVTSVTVGQTPIPTIGPPDRAAHDVSLKPAALLARVAPPAAVQPSPGGSMPATTGQGPA